LRSTEHLFDLVRLAAVDGRLAAFVVKRVDDHLEFSVAIQIKDCGDLTFSLLNRDSQHLDCWHIRSRAAAEIPAHGK
jgi:hypothetical protein